MSSLSSSSLRILSPKFPSKPSCFLWKSLSFLPSRSLLLSSPISFQPLPRSSPLPQPLRARPQQREEEQTAGVDLSLLPPKLRDIIALFQSVSEPKAKYQQLLHYGARLPPLDPAFKNEEHRVRGCVSQVWVRAFIDPEDAAAVRFEADSDSVLTKGLAALLVLGLSGSPAPVIARVPPDFVHLLGLRQSLTPSRNNGFLNMLKLMQQKALQLHADAADFKDSEALGTDRLDTNTKDDFFEGKDPILGGKANEMSTGPDSVVNGGRNSPGYHASDVEERLEEDRDAVDMTRISPQAASGGRRERMIERLERGLCPVSLEVEDISHLHASHAAVRGSAGGETHFNVRVISREFEGKSLVKRHRLVYELLQEELQSGLHALSIDAKTPSEAQSS
ncbi:sufE-like protein 1, chloroplastic/mitochondrial [Musa acuminata AAA Group]|uniref:sufE-like protein 1, chloroplastic/mitochondrial n=1 Tax=Musa acuminata AAA Group TaxID=214697 RepID=UPI0031D6D1A7